jgi:integrase
MDEGRPLVRAVGDAGGLSEVGVESPSGERPPPRHLPLRHGVPFDHRLRDTDQADEPAMQTMEGSRRGIGRRTDGSPHELRHAPAALAISEGVHARVLHARMGHSSITVTMDVYGGLFTGYDEGVATALDDAFSALFGSGGCQKPTGEVTALPTK